MTDNRTHSVRRGASLRRAATLAGAPIAAAALVLLPALPASAATPVTPAFTCAAANTDGSYTLFFSYTNSSAALYTPPSGTRNDVTPANIGATPPTTFQPGTHPAFSVTTSKGSVKWRLDTASADANTTTLCTGQAVVAESWSPFLLPAAAIVPFGLWFRLARRRQRVSPGR